MDPAPHLPLKGGVGANIVKKSNKHHFWAEMAKAGVVQHFG